MNLLIPEDKQPRVVFAERAQGSVKEAMSVHAPNRPLGWRRRSGEPLRRGILAIDIEGFGRRDRTDPVRTRLRERLYRLLDDALDAAEIPLESIEWRENLGDGLLMLADPHVSVARLLDPLVSRLAAELSNQNHHSTDAERLRLRVAIHDGQVLSDAHGYTGTALIHAFRLLNAEVVRAALRRAPAAHLVVVVSDLIWESIVSQEYPGIDPASFKPVRVHTKETHTRAWVHLPGDEALGDGALFLKEPDERVGALGGKRSRVACVGAANALEEAPSITPRGRPRNPRTDRVILEAAFNLIAEQGVGRASVEMVAARAGVGKGTIYRRWPSRAALVKDALGTFVSRKVPVPDTGTTRGDLIALVSSIISAYITTPAGRILPELLAETARNPDLAKAVGEFWVSRRKVMFEVLERGVSRGDLPANIDFELVNALLLGPIYYRFLIRDRPLAPEWAETVVDSVLGSMRSNTATIDDAAWSSSARNGKGRALRHPPVATGPLN
jgi:AcrR family transcriptional regulator